MEENNTFLGNDNFYKQPITQTLEKNYMPYAMSVIISRAIPEIDGFKPSHRKLLYTMYKMGLMSGARTKSSNVVGQTMKLNPHGDMAIYETMVRLTRSNEALLYPFVDSKGNFGKQYSRDMAFAAPRYTEVKLDPICGDIFGDIDKNTVDFVDNYDATMKEPVLLPTAFPNILVNPNQGIAVGMASNIASFNLGEICEATIEYMKNDKVVLSQYIKAPDFSTGATLLYDEEEMQKVLETGRGSFKLRSVYSYDKKNNCIEITEIPYSTTLEVIIEKIVELIKAGKIREISDVRDETDKNGLKITLDLKRGTDPDKLMTRLFKLTTLEDTFSCNFNLLIDGGPVVLGVRGILREWVRFRIGCVKRRLAYDIEKKSDRLHLLEGLAKILLDIDKAVSIIRHTELESMVVPNLMKGFDIDNVQAEYIADIKLRNLNREYILKRTEDIETLTKEILDLTKTLGSEAAVKKLIAKQLSELSKKYGAERKTQIIAADEVEHFSEEQFVEDYALTLFFTRDNYLKKVSAVSLRSSGKDHNLKEGDVILQEIDTTNKSDLLLFSDKGNVYKCKINDIADSKVSQMGEYLPNLLSMESDEKIVFIHPTLDYKGNFLYCFASGKMAKVPVNAYATKTNRKRLQNAYYMGSPLVKIVFLGEEEHDFVVFSNLGKALFFNSAKIPLKTTKTTQGVSVMISKKGSVVSNVVLASESGIEDVSYYKTKNIPAMGNFLREEDNPNKQMSLI
ncbi:MAG: topoisomerase IV [Ruminococcaceae bacterium]|nr:topoisomerase IV [Oscillospiraceae bacterium]